MLIEYTKLKTDSISSNAEPLSVLHLLGGHDSKNKPFLLASSRYFSPAGDWTLLGTNPKATFIIKGQKGTLAAFNKKTNFTGNPFNLLRKVFQMFTWQSNSSAAPPFFGGWVGAFSYDLVHAVENLSQKAKPDQNLPDIYLSFYTDILAYRHSTSTWHACAISEASTPSTELKQRTNILLEAVKTAETKIYKPQELKSVAKPISAFSQTDYLQAVRKVIDYIYAGDIFQVNLSQRFSLPLPGPTFDIMGHLLKKNPAPFSAYLSFADKAIISASPERFLKVKKRLVETRPIKGTRPRSNDTAQDKALAAELLASEKDKAELNMIIDLMRNDLGRVCTYDTIKVKETRRLEAYATVYHTVSIIEGTLPQGTDFVDLLKACWPGGSVTGAPKIRAMEIIAELEPSARSFYTGSIGYLGIDGSIDLNIVIRTLLFDGQQLTFQVGGGIVADSTPEAEYEETLHKAEGIMRTLGADGGI